MTTMTKKRSGPLAVAQSAALPALSFTEKMLAGAIARGVSQTVLHPIDVMRTRLQARSVSSKLSPQVFLKGVVPQITLAIPAGAIQFLAFETAKDKLVQLMPDDRFAQLRTLLAGACGALAAASCRVPQEVLKQRIQADIYPNVVTALTETLRVSGPTGLYTGWLATISRDVPWNSLSFAFHFQGKQIFEKVRGRKPTNDENLVIGSTAGAVAAVIMTPIDVVKTRIMTQKAGTATMGIMQTLQGIVREEGAATLMKGVVPRLVFLAPLAGITLSVYEAVAANIKKRKAAAAAAAHKPVALGLPDARPVPTDAAPTRLALRFSKVAVRVARADRVPGAFVGDYAASSRYVFSLAA